MLTLPLSAPFGLAFFWERSDMNAALKGHSEVLSDTVHPSTAGATLMAKAAYKAITGNDFQGEVPSPTPKP